MYGYHVSAEWAKQLLYEIGEDVVDYATMETVAVDEMHKAFRVAISLSVSVVSESLPPFAELDFEEIEIRAIGDRINHEVTYIGYGRQTNTCVLGLSYKEDGY